jgi:hypothetical protein
MNAPLHLSRVPTQRTEKGLAFEKWYNAVRNLLDGKTPEQQKLAYAMNQKLIAGLANPKHTRPDTMSALEKALMPSAVHVDTLINDFSVRYANDDYIGEQLMPPVVVSKRSDKYAVFPKREAFAFPEDAIGPEGEANELRQSRSTDNYSVKGYALMTSRDLTQIANEDAPYNELLEMAMELGNAIAFKREKRIFAIVFAAGSFGSNTAGASTKWDDSTGGTVITDLLAARAALWRGATPTKVIGYCTLDVWNRCIANNPKITALFTNQEGGLAVTTRLAKYFRLDDILITEAREETANEGQTATYARMTTSDGFGVVAVAQRPTLNSLHFGTTFRMQGDPFATQWMDPKVGERGGVRQRLATAEDHKIVAADAGYFITDTIT